MTELPDPWERPTLSIPEAGALLGLSRSQSYETDALPTIEISPHRKVVPTAKLLDMLGLQERATDDDRIRDLLDHASVELGDAITAADAALGRLREAITRAAAVAAALR